MTFPALLAPSTEFTTRSALLVMAKFLGLMKCVGFQILFVFRLFWFCFLSLPFVLKFFIVLFFSFVHALTLLL